MLPGHENQQAGLLLPHTPKAACIEVTTATLIQAFTDRTWFGLGTLCCSLRVSPGLWAISSSWFFAPLMVAVRSVF